jgi:hypothetical protein
VQFVLLGVRIVAAEVLHQFLDGSSARHKELDVIVGIAGPKSLLPGRRRSGLKDMDSSVFLRKGVVIAWGQTYAASWVPEVNAGERSVRWGAGKAKALPAPARKYRWGWCHDNRLRSGKCRLRWKDVRILHTIGLGRWKTRRRWPSVKTMEGIETSTSHGVRISGPLRYHCLDLLNLEDKLTVNVIDGDGMKLDEADYMSGITERGVGKDDPIDWIWQVELESPFINGRQTARMCCE